MVEGTVPGDVELRSAAPDMEASPHRPVLVVDDSRTTRLVIVQRLSLAGLINPVVECQDGEAAIAELTRAQQHGCVPVLLFLDRQMPGRSGLDVLGWMQQEPALANIPVIMLSSDDDAEGVTAAYALGVCSYLVKPVGFEALGAVVRDLDLPWLLA